MFKQSVEHVAGAFKRGPLTLLRYRYWKRWALRIKGLRILIVDLGAIVGVIGVALVIGDQLTRDTIQIEPIQIPDQLSESGYTSEAVAQRIMTSALAIRQAADQVSAWKLPDEPGAARAKDTEELGQKVSSRSRNDVAVPSIGVPPDLMGGTKSDFVVPGLSFSMNTLTTYIGELLGKRSNRVRGEIIKTKDGLYSLHLRFDGSANDYTSDKVSEEDLDKALQAGAEEIERRNDKLAWAVYLHTRGEKEKAQSLLDELIATLQEEDPQKVSAYNFRGLMYSDEGNFSDAIRCHRSASRAAPDDPTSFINLASALRSSEQYDEAVKVAIEAINLDPQRAAAHSTYGAVLLAIEDSKKAIREFEWLVSREPESADWHRSLAQALEQNGDREKATANYQRATELDPNNSEAYVGLANIHFDEGKLADAAEYYRKALAANPGDSKAARNLGLVLETSGDIENATLFYKKATEIDPTNSDAYIDLGNVFYNKGQIDEALQNYRSALIANPKETIAYGNLAFVLEQKGDLSGAIEITRKLVEVHPTSDSFAQLGGLLQEKGDIDGAIESFRTATSIEPKDSFNHAAIAFLLSTKGELDKKWIEQAKVEAGRAIDIDHTDAWALSVQCLILGQEGQFAEAIENCRQSILINPDEAMLYDNYGSVLNASGKSKEATELFAKAIQLDQAIGWPHFDWGNALFDQGDYQGALLKFKKGLELDTKSPRDSALHYTVRGLANFQIGSTGDAIADLKTAVAIDPNSALSFFSLGHVLNEAKRQAEGTYACQKAVDLVPSGEPSQFNLNFGVVGNQTVKSAIAACRKLVGPHPG